MMGAMQVDAVLERYGPPPTIELPPWIADARRGINEAIDQLLAIDEADLGRRWWWRDDRVGGAEARYAFFRSSRPSRPRPAPRTGPSARDVATSGGRRLRRRDDRALGPARAPGAADRADLDADPGGGEWTIRQTLAHAVNVERAYPSFSAWWLGREQTPELPPSVPDDVGEGFPDEGD